MTNEERRRSRRNRRGATRQRMAVAEPDARIPTDDDSQPAINNVIHPAPEDVLSALPVPTPTSASASTAEALPLVTQPVDVDSVRAAIARRQNTVVTVTSTQFGGTLSTNPNSQSGGLPITTIAASASVGVFMAVSIVGCWWWFCKRPYSRKRSAKSKPSSRPSHKNQFSTSSVAPLKGNNSAPQTPVHGAFPNSREKSQPPGSLHSHSHSRSTSGSSQQQRRPAVPVPVPPPAVLPPSNNSSTPPRSSSKRRSPPGQTPPSPSGRTSFGSDPTSPASTLVEDSSTPSKGSPRPGSGGRGSKGYVPQKPSPLTVGVERAKPKEKPKEKSRVNEWATGFPVSGSGSPPSSPTRSSSSGHGGFGSTTMPVPEQPLPRPHRGPSPADLASRQSANLLAIPEPAAHYHSRKDRISVLSDSSYYALDPDEDERHQSVYMGVAYGGDEPSPIPEEYFSPNWGDEEEEEEEERMGRGSKMHREQESYLESRRSGYGYQQRDVRGYDYGYAR